MKTKTTKTMKTKEQNNKKRFNYFYDGVAIQKSRFIKAVPSTWKKEINKHGEYSFGYYRAIQI